MRLRAGMAVTLAVVVTLAGCSGQEPGDSLSTPTTPPSSPPPPGIVAYDPPLAFAADGVTVVTSSDDRSLTALDYDVRGAASYSAAAGALVATDLATGQTLWSVELEGGLDGGPARSAPQVVEVGGSTVVFVVFHGVIEGTGTTADRRVLRLLAADAGDGTTVWEIEIEGNGVPGDIGTGDYRLAAASERYVVVSSAGDLDEFLGRSRDFTVVVDAVTGELRWGEELFYAVSLDGDVIAGVGRGPGYASDETLVGRSVVDGATMWTREDARLSVKDAVTPLAAGRVVAEASMPAAGFTTLVVDVGSGETVLDLGQTFDRCLHDQQTVVVCMELYFDEPRLVTAWDTTTGERLWSLPDDTTNRIAPTVTAVWHGAVYGFTDNGPVIVDAVTGEDRAADVAIAPDRVIAGFGIVVDGDVVAYAAIG